MGPGIYNHYGPHYDLTPAQEDWIYNRTQELRGEGLSDIQARIQAHQEFKKECERARDNSFG